MPINVDIALGAATEPAEFSWTASDVQLYHLAIGAGADPVSETELRYLQDKTPQVLPTFATVASGFHAVEPPKVSFPGIEIDLAKILHGTEQVTAHRPLPPSGTARSEGKVVEIWDKGKAAVIVTETTTSDDQGPLWTIRRSIFARGEGGFGGERGPSSHGGVPERDADLGCPRTSCRSRRCCIGCVVTVIRCTPIRPSRQRPGFPPHPAWAVQLRRGVQGSGRRGAGRGRLARDVVCREVRRSGVSRRDPEDPHLEGRRQAADLRGGC